MTRWLRGWGEEVPLERLEVSAYEIPTDLPESDGTLKWDKTTLVIVRAVAGGLKSLGYGYADLATAKLIDSKLQQVIHGMDALQTSAMWWKMVREIRNLGRPGIVSMAISAVDIALWDLKARLLEIPLVTLLGGEVRQSIPIYGSGGFTSYTDEELRRQMSDWAAQGCKMVKMKVGRHPEQDVHRVQVARQAVGPDVELFVDANGALTRKQALLYAERFAEEGVRWFEEPVSSDDLEGLRLMRDRGPAGMSIAAGEYGYDATYFRRMLEAQAVDILQADVSRCGGITGFLQVAGLCTGFNIPLSAHTVPTVHTSLGCALQQMIHLEYFHDHVRIERMFFDGVPEPFGGALRPDRMRPGLGIEFKEADVKDYAA